MIVIGSSQQIPFYQNTTGAAEITLITDAPEDGIDEICIFHNGGIVNLITRNLIVTDNRKSKSMTKKYTINLLPGSKNLLQSWPELPELIGWPPAGRNSLPMSFHNLGMGLLPMCCSMLSKGVLPPISRLQ